MALLKTEFYKQVSLATISKMARSNLAIGETMEIWEADVVFKMNKADFNFAVHHPTKRIIKKISQKRVEFVPLITYEANPLKRFLTKEEAEAFILFNIIQIYKPLKNYISDNNLEDEFNNLLDKHPEKILRELEHGKNWLVN
jgi:hypothetical protein